MQCSRQESCSRGFTLAFTFKAPGLFVRWYTMLFSSPLVHSEVLAPVQGFLRLACYVGQSLRSLGMGVLRVGVDVGAGDAEVDVIYISFIVSVQYIGY